MSECEEYTPPMDEIKRWYSGAVDEYRCDTGMSRDEAEAAFDRAIAARDRALREQIAQKIEVEMRRHDNAQIGFSAVGDAYAHAARIAREEGDAHRPERCPTCGCELAYPTAVHVVDCGEGSE